MKPKEIVRAIMEYYGFPRNTKTWQDYESAKQLVFKHYTGRHYNEIIKAITEWVGV